MRQTDTEVPDRMWHLPRNKAGYVVPWFVAYIDGEWDFRVIKAGGIEEALNSSLCWLCGKRLGRYVSFVIGPMCAVNRVSAEPGSHRECATYAAKACPFLTTPKMERRERGIPEEAGNPAGVMIRRNPGVTLVWTSTSWYAFRQPGGVSGILIDVGDPTSTEWYAEGREATRAEVLDSIESGLPILAEQAMKDGGDAALDELQRMVERAQPYLPEAS